MRVTTPADHDAGTIVGGCACGAIRFVARGAPVRSGLCHCLTCRKSHGAAFNPFVVFRGDAVDIEGSPVRWLSSPGYERMFCATCGSRLGGGYVAGPEIELTLGSFDETGRTTPQYESWTIHREPWLHPLAVPQHDHDRPDPGDTSKST